MKRMMKKVLGAVCAVVMLATMIGALPVSAISGGGSAGTGSIHAWGCDMSYYNVDGDTLDYSMVDFNLMKADGCEYVILRVGYEASASRVDTLDKAFVGLYNKAREAGLGIGVYFYALAKDQAGAIQDAQWCISIFEQYDMYFEYPIYYDVEDPGNSSRPSHESLTSAQTTALCLGWAQTLEAAGYFPGVYAGYYVLADLTWEYTSNYDTWIASVTVNGTGTQYNPTTDKLSYQTTYGMWQYKWYNDTWTPSYNGSYWQDSNGYPLDCNVAFKDYPTIIANGGYNNLATKHTITFETNGGSVIDPVRVTDGETLSQPANPSRRGFDFAGWYCNSELTDPYDFSTPVPYGFTLYAKWDEAYWGANTNLMPNEAQMQLVNFQDTGEKIWPYWNNDAYGSVTMYNGVTAEWAWPEAYMAYENSFDAMHDSYIYVKKDGTAYFNASITYMANDGKLYTVKLSELAGQGETDFAPGYMEFFVNLGQFVTNMNHMPASGNLKFTKVTYYVVGAKDSYVKLYDMKLTPKFEIDDPYVSLYDKNVQQIGGKGSYVYDNGVLTMESISTDGYSVRLNVNKSFSPANLTYLIADMTSTVPYNITMELTHAGGDATLVMRKEFFNHFGYTEEPPVLPAGTCKEAMNMYGYYEWNGGIPAESTIKSVTIALDGAGTFTLNALQVSRNETAVYVQDGEYSSGTLGGEYPNELTSSVFTVGDAIVSRVKAGTTLPELLAGFDQQGYVSVYTADGVKLTGVQTVASGMTVAIEYEGATVREYTLAVNGDVNGDGEATTVDARIIIGSVLGESVLSDWQAIAADYDNDGDASTTDVRALLTALIG